MSKDKTPVMLSKKVQCMECKRWPYIEDLEGKVTQSICIQFNNAK